MVSVNLAISGMGHLSDDNRVGFAFHRQVVKPFDK